MINKAQRFTKAFWQETIKRLPYIGAVLIVLIFLQSVQHGRNDQKLLHQVASLSQDNKTLSQQNKVLNQQNKDLGQQNKNLSAQSVSLIKCVGYTFANYTQDQTPIYFTDIDKCVTASQGAMADNGSPPKSNQATAPKPQSQLPASPSSSSHSPQQPSQSQRPSQPPGLVKQVLDFLGL